MKSQIGKSEKLKTDILADGSVKKQLLTDQPQGLEKVISKCYIDTKKWEVDDFNVKQNASGEFLWTVYLKKKTFAFNKEIFLDELKKISTVCKKIIHPKENNDLLLSLCIFDSHVGKYASVEETGTNYNLKIAVDLYRKAIDYTLSEAKKHKISKILFPIGQDFLHIDSKSNLTTAGTPQDVDTRASKIFLAGKNLLIESIEKMKQIAPVDVVCVPGNHEENSMFHLAECVSCYYDKDENVFVNNSPKVRKYFSWGKNLIGLTHGDKEKINDLAVLMATECPKGWSNSKYRFWLLGHFHTSKMFIDEKCGVQIEVLPSLSGTDFWHSGKGYTGNTRSSASSLYSKEKGLVGKIYYNV